MSVDRDIKRFNHGLDELFKAKPINNKPAEVIKGEEQKTPFQKKRTRRTQTDVYSMVGDYPHHEGDKAWLVAQLQTLPIAKREAAMMQYAQIYTETYQAQADENRREGQARREANSWLVELIDRLNKR